MTDYQFYKRMGICPRCKINKIFGSESNCVECRAYTAKWAEKNREKNKEHKRIVDKKSRTKIVNQRKENGQCFRCGKKLTDLKYKTCHVCRYKAKEWQRQYRLKNG